ncbi:MAG: ABC transporter ATP-binding protein [Spirochaetales bacterium]|nr:ABC transporter ATP-binding protein [Spirochaetales bacterium]
MIEFANASYRYKGEPRLAVDGLSLRALPGRVLALLGPNGSGKSTALGMAAGWLKPCSGTVSREGRAAFLPQSERLAFSFTCCEYVTFGRAPHLPYLGVPGGRERELALRALDSVGMGAFAKKRITALSGGELQLVRLARALVQDSAWVILDEPTDMLDPAHVAAVGAVVRDMARAGKGVLVSTHDLYFALASADDAALIKAGRLLSHGPTAATLEPGRLSELYGVTFELRQVPAPVNG